MAVAVLGVCLNAGATSYYVSNAGDDRNNGTSPATAWQTLGKVNGQSFNAGDTIYLQRGGVWSEQLVPFSSGSSGNPIRFDAYGIGAAPMISAAVTIPFVSGSWTRIAGGNAWKADVTLYTPFSAGSPTVNVVKFGNVYGRKQPYGGGCTSSIVSKYDWCVSWPSIYVFSPGGANPVETYASDGAIVPTVATASGLQMIYVNGKMWLTA
jgi:hypothetical protein